MLKKCLCKLPGEMHRWCISPHFTALIPDFITLFRLLLAPFLIFAPFGSSLYTLIYLCCGFSDLIDGRLARRLCAVSRLGNLLDSISDFVFFCCAFWSILPLLQFSNALITLLSVALLLKGITALLGFHLYHRWVLLHTLPLKCTGLLLYLLPLVLPFESVRFPLSICIAAVLASVDTIVCLMTGDIHE